MDRKLMKRFFLALLFLALAVPAYPWGGSMMVVGGGTPAAGGGAPTYLFKETFDGAVSCGDLGNSTCENPWTAATAGAYNTQYTPPLEGTYSLQLTDTSGSVQVRNTNNFTTADPIYFYGQINFGVITGIPSGDLQRVFSLLTSGGNQACSFGLRDSTGVKWAVQSAGGTAYTSIAPSTDTTYHVWGEFKKGASSDGYCKMWVATTATKPETPSAQRTGITNTNDAVRIYIDATTDVTEPMIIDRILIDDADIGSSP